MNRKLANEELGRIDLESFKNAEKTPIVVVLDNIRSLNNIGSVFRTADAMAIEAVYLCGITAQPPHREINKTALGATESVHWKYYEKTEVAVASLKEEGYTILSIEQTEGSVYLNDFEVRQGQKLALVFGHEVYGVEQDIIDLSDAVVEIPQKGTKHSLNISVSAGVVLWDLSSKFEKLS
ncbi:MAG: tRNA G18 (ribose-2'-O)-methylase SpoU [Vicingaceae bacterium]|jgi:tRNA G18 (ribose-2'-O)-methylase SpoU